MLNGDNTYFRPCRSNGCRIVSHPSDKWPTISSISEELSRGGYAFLSTTRLQGKTVLRYCTINPRTTEADLRETIRRLDWIARTLVRSA
jgi:hypothetical protein